MRKTGRAFIFFIMAVAWFMAAGPSPGGARGAIGGLGRTERCPACHETAVTTHPGRLLIGHPPERFGCVVCHGGNGGASRRKAAHSDLRYPVPPVNLLDDPQRNVRHFLRGAEAQGSCFKCHNNVWDELTDAPVLSTGARFFLNNCSGCHQGSGLESWRKLAPPLTRIRWKVSRDWATRFLKDPRSVQPKTRMPNFFLADGEVQAMVDYLFRLEEQDIPTVPWDPISLKPKEAWAGDDLDRWVRIFRKGAQIWEEARCPVCHASCGRAARVPFELAPSLERVADKVKRDWLYLWLKDPPAYYPHTYMPRFRFTDADLRALVHYLWWDERFTAGGQRAVVSPAAKPSPATVREGRALVAYYGCAGCHEIQGHEGEWKIGVTLSDFGAKPLEQLTFGRQEIPPTRQAWIARKLLDPRFTAKATLRNPRMPDLGLRPEQVRALTVFLMGLTGETIPPPLKPTKPGIGEPPPPTPENLARGRALFQQYCTACHGQAGRGEGTGWFESFPRDLTAGLYLSRSTLGGGPPTERDLFRTLTRGMPGSAMPPFAFLPETERWQLVHYVRSLVKGKSVHQETIVIPEALPPTPASLARGKALFEGLKCFLCHGQDAKGRTREAGEFEDWVDAAGRPVPRSADLTRGIFKGGSGAQDLYRILKMGFGPMPPFGFFFTKEADLWALVHYVQSLSRKDLLKKQ
ncbi:MAG: c-type cytochrome [Candidatus Tectomicrobia bacterium]|uniref:C-type cytochrome n=1 Tax=Tectimicrobiota bacterium TaxID=2528274 RepID=A0A932FVD7_UNCTE|nr:c-type cytochrome [Candidatus Tectomicrobia bacterium]